MKKIQFSIADKKIGDHAPVLIQSMSDIKTSRVEENISLSKDLEKRGLDMMRFSVLDREDALALSKIKSALSIPVIADIHCLPDFAFLALESGVSKIRINPGNFHSLSKLRNLIQLAKEKNVAMRIGVNEGSLNQYRGKTKSEVEDILFALDDTLQVFQEENFDHLVLSLKTSNPDLILPLYEKAYEKYPYPLHVGLTESGLPLLGSIRSTYALSKLLEEGIGDTIRISLAGERKEEIRACKEILKLTKRRKNVPTLIVCPGCGRTLIDLKEVASLVQEKLDFIQKDIKVAVMGCPVNGIGESRDSDIGISGNGKKDGYLLFEKGKAIGIYSKEEALSRLFSFIDQF